MSRTAVLAAVLLLLVAPVHAAYYATIVDDDAPASDVVNAANFAATMKASAGVSFTGVLASEAPARIMVRSDPVMRVHFDGEDVTIVASDLEFGREIELAQEYLDGQGFDVKTLEYLPLVEETEAEEPVRACCKALTAECLACAEGIPVEEYCLGEPMTIGCPDPCARVRCAAGSTCVVEDGTPVCVQELQEEQAPPPAPAPPEEPKQGVFVRFWGWLKGLFG